jgi:hypothetical protein
MNFFGTISHLSLRMATKLRNLETRSNNNTDFKSYINGIDEEQKLSTFSKRNTRPPTVNCQIRSIVEQNENREDGVLPPRE